jgi:hypothetical protein
MRRLVIVLVLVAVAGLAGPVIAVAAGGPNGTWVMQPAPGSTGGAGTGGLTMTVAAWGKGGRKLTYRIKVPAGEMVSTVESALDGKDAAVVLNGKPTGESMAIKGLDDHHTVAVLKFKGEAFGTAKWTFSPDFKTLTVENEITKDAAGRKAGKHTEVVSLQPPIGRASAARVPSATRSIASRPRSRRKGLRRGTPSMATTCMPGRSGTRTAGPFARRHGERDVRWWNSTRSPLPTPCSPGRSRIPPSR